MKDFDLLDQDEQALMKKPRPIGWFAAGAVSILALGFAFGFYMPLSSAHEKLLGEHEKLAQKSQELDHALKGKTASLSATEGKRQELERFVTTGRDAEKTLKSQAEIAHATAANSLAAFTKAKLVESKVTDTGLEISYAEKVLFRPRTSSLLPQAKRPFCAAADALKQNSDWVVRVRTTADPGDDKYWETAGERAGTLAAALKDSCGISEDKISVAVVRPAAGDDASRIIAEYGPLSLPRLKGSEAPLGESGSAAPKSAE